MRRVSPVLALLAACSRHPAQPAATPSDGAPAAPPVTPAVADGAAAATAPASIDLPDGSAGIGFDDLQYAPELGRLLVPAGRTGRLDLVDPATGAIEEVTGFSADAHFGGGHGEGTTSAVHGDGWIFAIDRTAHRLDIVNPATRAIVAHTRLAADPDYVRWVAARREVWVTEPDAEQIEVFALAAGTPPAATATARIRVPGGPESLVIEPATGRAYTHLWEGRSVAIDLTSRKIVADWANGCRGSRGIAVDAERGWLLVGCSEGRVVALALADGRQLGAVDVGAGVDIIAYDPAARRVYAPGARAGTVAVVEVATSGALSVVAELPGAAGSHCAVGAGGRVWICDPAHGRLIEVTAPIR